MTRNEYLNLYVNKWGWHIVPVVKGEKRPAVNWKAYQSLKPTKQELHDWFIDPDMGVGVVTGPGSGVMVVDEDSYKQQGKVLALNTPLIVQTGGGGKHYYFKYKEGVANTVNVSEAVDIRGQGGFAVLPPTLHPSGNEYRWLTDPLPPDLYDLPTLDDSLMDDFVKKHQAGEPVRIEDYISVQQGGRDDSLLRLSLSVVNKHNEKEAWIIINAINDTYDPPLADREVERIFKQAVTYIRTHPTKTREEIQAESARPLEVLTWSQAQGRYQDLMKKYGDGVTTGYQILDEYIKLVPQQLYMISAPTHVGKTTLVLNIAGRVARSGFSVCVASLEQGVFVVPRIESMFGDEAGLDNLSFIAPTQMPKPDDFAKTFAQIENRPKVLIVDHLHYFERGNKGATEEMDRLVVQLQMLANSLEIPIIAIAHIRKLNADKPPTMEDLKDSSSLSQIPAFVAMMNRDKNDPELVKKGGRIFADTGTLYLYKNRIFGRTGSEDFTLLDSGEIIFNRNFSDQINKAAAVPPGLEGFFDG